MLFRPILLRQVETDSHLTLVIADGAWSNSRTVALGNEPYDKAVDELTGAGFTTLKHGKWTFYIAPTIWQAEEMKKALEVYAALKHAVGTDHHDHLAGNPAALNLMKSLFESQGFGVTEDTAIAVNPHRTFNLSSGDRHLSVTNPEIIPPEDALWLSKNAAKRRDSNSDRNPIPKAVRVIYPQDFKEFGLGDLTLDGEGKLEGFRDGVGQILIHFQDFFKRRSVVYTDLQDRFFGDIGVEFGKGFGQLSSASQQGLSNGMFNQFGQLGFNSPADGMKILNQSTLDSTNTGIMFSIGVGPNQFITIQLP